MTSFIKAKEGIVYNNSSFFWNLPAPLPQLKPIDTLPLSIAVL